MNGSRSAANREHTLADTPPNYAGRTRIEKIRLLPLLKISRREGQVEKTRVTVKHRHAIGPRGGMPPRRESAGSFKRTSARMDINVLSNTSSSTSPSWLSIRSVDDLRLRREKEKVEEKGNRIAIAVRREWDNTAEHS